MEIKVEHHPEQSRFQAQVDGQLCVADYRLSGKVMNMTHTGVPPAAAGRGVAAELVRVALDHARQQGWKVNPLCSYVDAYMRRHPETMDLHA